MDQRITIIRGDITTLDVDAIVNAANPRLAGGGGVDGAIHRAGGPAIMEACRQIGGCPTGEAVITPGGQLKARFVIHAVGPVWHGGDAGEAELLAQAYQNAMKRAVEKKLPSIAFPNISTGIYGFPKESAAKIALETVNAFLVSVESINQVIFCCFDDENFRIYESEQ